MNINLDAYQVFMIATTSLAAFFGLGKLIAKQTLVHISEKLETLKEVKQDIKNLATNIQNTERDLLRIKSDIAQQYVRRDDFIRLETHLTSKLDALGDKIDNLRERRVSHQ